MVQFGAHTKRRKIGKRTNPILLVFVFVIGIFCTAVLFASHSLSSEQRNLSEVYMRVRTEFLAPVTKLRTDLIYKNIPGGVISKRGGESLWELLIEEGIAVGRESSNEMHALEVGMYSPYDCLHAASLGMNVHCMEPSPMSNLRQMTKFESKENEDIRNKIRFYKAAAANETGKMINFQSGGGHADHVGELLDTWNLTKKEAEKHGTEWLAADIEPFLVKTIAVDDIVSNKAKPTVDYSEGNVKIDNLFLAMIDTNGYEPEVLEGMKTSISEHKIDYVITKFWPKVIDLMHEKSKRCEKPVELLNFYLDNDYTLYSMHVGGHPSAPWRAKRFIKDNDRRWINYDDVNSYCGFFYEADEKYPHENYYMGYWTTILAVSPNARLASSPSTELGQILKPIMPDASSSIM